MSRWTHSICFECWLVRELSNRTADEPLEVREPHRLNTPFVESCCSCGHIHQSGIYIRLEPDSFDHCLHVDDAEVAQVLREQVLAGLQTFDD
jgi:hypothetical protein